MLADVESLPLPPTEPESVGFSSKRLERFHHKMHSLVDENHMAGIVSFITRHGKIFYQDAYGKQDIENNIDIQADTIFRLYSMTKPITGIAMMMLYEEGRWHPDDLLIQHFPEFADLKVHAGFDQTGKMILERPKRFQTMGQLLSQTAGFSIGIFPTSPVDKMYSQERPMDANSSEEFIQRLTKLPLAYHPGDSWLYSVSTDIQGALIERLTNMSLSDFLHTRVFEPLGMKDTGFFVPEEKIIRLATTYMLKSNELYALPISSDVNCLPGFQSGGGGLYSTAKDYVRFLQMMANKGELEGTRLLAPCSINLMRSNQLPDELMRGGLGIGFQQMRPGFGYGYNLGIFTEPAKAGSSTGLGTYTWDGAAGTWFWVDPTNDIVFVSMIQRILSFGEFMPNIQNLSRALVHQALLEP